MDTKAKVAKKVKAQLGWQPATAATCEICGEYADRRGGRMYRSTERTYCEPCKERSDLEGTAAFHAWYPANKRKGVDKEFRQLAARLREAAERIERDVERALTGEDNDPGLERSADSIVNDLSWLLPNLHPHHLFREIGEYRTIQRDAAAFFAAHPELAPADKPAEEGSDGDA